MEDVKVKFIKIYSRLPDKIKKEDIIVVIEDRPFTWDVAYFEIRNDSSVGKNILKKLKDMEIL